jgi:hypothetical protein
MSKHNPGNNNGHLDSGQLEAAIARYQSGEVAALSEIIGLATPRAQTLIRYYGTFKYRPEDELISDINWKLCRSIARFDPARGTGFSFVSNIIFTTLRSNVTSIRKRAARHVELDKALIDAIPANGASEPSCKDGVDDLVYRVRSEVRSTVAGLEERAAQRWFVDSFCQDGFEEIRHECCNAATQVFSELSSARARELHDISLLETRRALYPHLPPRPAIVAGKLLGTRSGWMAQYRPLMDEAEFSKFTRLMKNLAPYTVLLLNPENRSRRGDRCATVSRSDVETVLFGSPGAELLFPPDY